MALPSTRLIVSTTVLIALGCVGVMHAHYTVATIWTDAVVGGFLLGTMFAHTTVASAWAAFGPGPLSWRVPLSLIWIALLSGSWMINHRIYFPGAQSSAPFMCVHLFCQWLALQPLLWGVALICRLGLRGPSESGRVCVPSSDQFTIRHLLVWTALTGCGLGLGRLFYGDVAAAFSRGDNWAMYGPIVLVGAVISLLLISAAFSRWYVLATLFTLISIALTSVWEPPLIKVLEERWIISRQSSIFGATIFTYEQLICINTMTAIWILAFVMSIRLCGYGLVKPPTPEPSF